MTHPWLGSSCRFDLLRLLVASLDRWHYYELLSLVHRLFLTAAFVPLVQVHVYVNAETFRVFARLPQDDLPPRICAKLNAALGDMYIIARGACVDEPRFLRSRSGRVDRWTRQAIQIALCSSVLIQRQPPCPDARRRAANL
ncbi:hypothetical protein MSAN_02396200 [Mycena sanguinolenta]|uniref:Uncharacterized protein n=1 Tax=Mycena sanguinolenta TaxID=230812 RepID=A0A8H7CFV3_9AGAR|nr:hypothetical protein MSAN_02396200 [Mycena sanguinolenta]